MERTELVRLIERVKRSTASRDVIAVCEELERLVFEPGNVPMGELGTSSYSVSAGYREVGASSVPIPVCPKCAAPAAVGERKRPGRKPVGDKPLTGTERVRRYRDKRREAKPNRPEEAAGVT